MPKMQLRCIQSRFYNQDMYKYNNVTQVHRKLRYVHIYALFISYVSVNSRYFPWKSILSPQRMFSLYNVHYIFTFKCPVVTIYAKSESEDQTNASFL